MREEIRNDLIQLLENHPDSRLMQSVNDHLDGAVHEIVERRIKPAMAADPELDMPPMREIRENIKETLVAAVAATACAALAGRTPSYTDEGGCSTAMILGLWAGTVMSAEASTIVEQMEEQMHGEIRSYLGMGDN
jgi:hypothetical protein